MMPDKLLWWWHRYRLKRAQKNITPHCFQEIHAAKGTKEKREIKSGKFKQTKNLALQMESKTKEHRIKGGDGQSQDTDSEGAVLCMKDQEPHGHQMHHQATEPSTPPEQRQVNQQSLSFIRRAAPYPCPSQHPRNQ